MLSPGAQINHAGVFAQRRNCRVEALSSAKMKTAGMGFQQHTDAQEDFDTRINAECLMIWAGRGKEQSVPAAKEMTRKGIWPGASPGALGLCVSASIK